MCLGNNTFTPVLITGTVSVSLNPQREEYPRLQCPSQPWPQVSTLQPPNARLKKRGVASWAPRLVLEVETSNDCMLSYAPISKRVNLHNLEYVQPNLSLYNTAAGNTMPPQSLRPLHDWLPTSRKSCLLVTAPNKGQLFPHQLRLQAQLVVAPSLKTPSKT